MTLSFIYRSRIWLFLVLLMAGGTLQAQPPLPRERLQQLRIAFYSEKLDLTPEEAQKFWPVHNAYADEVDKLREERRRLLVDLRQNAGLQGDEELEAIADKHITLLEEEVSVQKRFHSRFKAVLPIAKVLRFYRAEKEFPRWLLRQVREQRGGGFRRNE